MSNLELFFKSGQKFVKYDGQEYRVRESLKNEYIVVDGRRVNINNWFGDNSQAEKYSSNLTEHPQRHVNYYKNLIAEKYEEMDFLKTAGEALKKQYIGARNTYYEFLSECGVDKYSKIGDKAKKAEAKELYSGMLDLKMAKTANSNRQFTACNTQLDYISQLGNWQNQLNLAKHVQNSIWS